MKEYQLARGAHTKFTKQQGGLRDLEGLRAL